LDKTGTLDALTRGLVALYETPTRPDDPLAFFTENLSISHSLKAEFDVLKLENEELRKKVRFYVPFKPKVIQKLKLV